MVVALHVHPAVAVLSRLLGARWAPAQPAKEKAKRQQCPHRHWAPWAARSRTQLESEGLSPCSGRTGIPPPQGHVASGWPQRPKPVLRGIAGTGEATGATLRVPQAGSQHGARGELARARGRRWQRQLLGLSLPPFARLIALPARGARQPPGHLPPHSSREPSRPGLPTPAPHRVPTCGDRRVPRGAGRKEFVPHVRVPRTGGRSAPAPICHRSRSQLRRGQVQTAAGLLTALPARRPLKRKREEETTRVRKESAFPGRAAGANHSGCGAGRGSSALSCSRSILRLSPATPSHAAPPGLDSQPEDIRPSPPPPHTPTLSQPGNVCRVTLRAAEFPRLSTHVGARVETLGLLFRGVNARMRCSH